MSDLGGAILRLRALCYYHYSFVMNTYNFLGFFFFICFYIFFIYFKKDLGEGVWGWGLFL